MAIRDLDDPYSGFSRQSDFFKTSSEALEKDVLNRRPVNMLAEASSNLTASDLPPAAAGTVIQSDPVKQQKPLGWSRFGADAPKPERSDSPTVAGPSPAEGEKKPLGWSKDWSAPPIEVTAKAEPPAKEDTYGFLDAAADYGKRFISTVIDSVSNIPSALEAAGRKAARESLAGSLSGEVELPGTAGIITPTATMPLGNYTMPREEAEQTADVAIAKTGQIESFKALSDYGSKKANEIRDSLSEDGKKALEGSRITGNIFKGEIDFGSDPTFTGYLLNSADIFGSLLPTVVTAMVTKSPAAGAAVGGTMAAGDGASTAREYIGGMSDQELEKSSPYYARLVKSGVDRETARTVVTQKAEENAAVLQGIVATAGSYFTGKLVTGAMDDFLTGLAKGRVGRAAAGATVGLTEEGFQEVTEGVAADVGIKTAGVDREIGTDSAANLVLGALGGGPVGGFKGFLTPGKQDSNENRKELFAALNADPEQAAKLQAAGITSADDPKFIKIASDLEEFENSLGELAKSVKAADKAVSGSTEVKTEDAQQDTYFGRPLMDSNALRKQLGNVRFMNYMAAVYENGDEDTKATIDELVNRTSTRENFLDALNREDRITEGRNLLDRERELGSVGSESGYILASAEKLLTEPNQQVIKKAPKPRPITQLDLERQDEAGRMDALVAEGQAEIDQINEQRAAEGKKPLAPSTRAQVNTAPITQRTPEDVERLVSAYSGVSERLQSQKPEAARVIALANRRKMISEGFTSEEADAIFGRFINTEQKPASQNAAESTQTESVNLPPSQDGRIEPTLSESPAELVEPKGVKEPTLTVDQINEKLNEARENFGDVLRRSVDTKNILPEEKPASSELLNSLAEYLYWLMRLKIRNVKDALGEAKRNFGKSMNAVKLEQFQAVYDKVVTAINEGKLPYEPELSRKAAKDSARWGDRKSQKVEAPKSVSLSYKEAKSRAIANPTMENAIAFRDALKAQMTSEALKRVRAAMRPKDFSAQQAPEKIDNQKIADIVGNVQDEVDRVIATLPPRVQSLFNDRTDKRVSAIDRIGSEVLSTVQSSIAAELAPKIREEEEFREDFTDRKPEKAEKVGGPDTRTSFTTVTGEDGKTKIVEVKRKPKKAKPVFKKPEPKVTPREFTENEKVFNKFKALVEKILSGANTPQSRDYAESVRAITAELEAINAVKRRIRYSPDAPASELIKKTIDSLEKEGKEREVAVLRSALQNIGKPLPVSGMKPSQLNDLDAASDTIKALEERRSSLVNADTMLRSAEVFANYIQIYNDLAAAQREAKSSSLTEAQVTELFGDAMRQVKWVADEKGRLEKLGVNVNSIESILGGMIAGDIQSERSFLDADVETVDGGEPGGVNLARDIVADIASGRVNTQQGLVEISFGLKSGEFTVKDVMDAFKERGIDPPARAINLAGQLHFQYSLSGYADKFRDHPNPIGAWLSSLHNYLVSAPEQMRKLRIDSLSKNEREIYREFYNNVKNGLPLFTDLSLDQMENTSLIQDPILRSAVEYLAPTTDDRRELWMRDVLEAERAGIPGMFGEGGTLTLADQEQFAKWKKHHHSVIAKEIRRKQRHPLYGALAQAYNVPNTVLRKYWDAISASDHNTSVAILAEAKRLHDAVADLREKFSQSKKADTRLSGVAAAGNKSSLNFQEAVDKALFDLVKEISLDDRQRSLAADEMMAKIERRRKERDFAGEARDEIDAIAEADAMAFQSDKPFESEDAIANAADERTVEEIAQEGGDITGLGDIGSLLDTSDIEGQLDDGDRLRRGGYSGLMSALQVASLVEQIKAAEGGNLPNIVVLGNPFHLPNELRERVLAKYGKNVGAKGLFDAETGTTYLFSDFMTGAKDVEFTIFHEVYGHFGIRGVLGDNLNGFLEQQYRTNPRIKSMADAAVKARRIGRLEAVEEVLADLAMEGAPGPFQRFLGRVALAIKPFMPRVAAWLESRIDLKAVGQIAWILREAKDYGRRGRAAAFNGAPSEVMLSEAPPPYELYSIKGTIVTGYARFNPITGDWYVFTNKGADVRVKGYQTVIVDNLEEVQKILRNAGGKVEMRTRSALFVDDKTPVQLSSFEGFKDPSEMGAMRRIARAAMIDAQNVWIPIFERVKFLEQKYGKLSDRENPMKAVLLFEKRAAAVLEDFKKTYVDPIKAQLKVLGEVGGNVEMEFDGATRSAYTWYLIARHAPERNKYIAKLTKGQNKSGSGMTDEKAAEVLRKLKADLSPEAFAALEAVGRLTDQMSKEKVSWMYNKGLITADQAAAMRQTYEHYVPLRTEEVDKTQLPTGKAFNLRGQDARRATGRGKGNYADDVLENALLDFESVIIRGEKNVVVNTVVAMLERFPDPTFARVNVLKYRQKVQKDGTTREVPFFRPDGSIDLVPLFNKTREIPNYEVVTERDTNYINNPEVVVAKIGGRPVTVEFTEAGFGTFLDSIHGGFTIEEQTSGAILLQNIGRLTRFMSKMFTTYNPEWIPVNAARDIEAALANAVVDGKLTNEQRALILKSMPKALNAAVEYYYQDMKGLGWMSRRGKRAAADPDMLAMIEEMRRAGGITLFLDRNNLEQVSRDLRIAIQGPSGAIENMVDKVKPVLDYVEALSTPIELMPRLSVYYALRKTGWSKSDAAVFAGDITVNFNMRGRARWLRNLYVFWGPTVNGTEKMYRLAKENPKRFTAIGLSLFTLGFLMNFIGRSNGDDDEEGINPMDKIPDYKRSTSIIVAPDTPLGAIPLAYGWNFFYAAGHWAADAAQGIRPATESMFLAIKAGVEAFMPQSSGLEKSTLEGKIIGVLTPSLGSPIVDIDRNENRFGAPIIPEKGAFTPYEQADAYMHFDSVSPLSSWVSKKLLEITGGRRYETKDEQPFYRIDFNPAILDQLIQSYAPGAFTTGYKLVSTGARLARGEEVARKPMPFVDKFSAYASQGFDEGAFRRVENLVETKWKDIQDPSTTDKQRDAIIAKYPEIEGMHVLTSGTASQIRQLRSIQRMMDNDPTIPDAEKVKSANEIDAEVKGIYKEFVTEAVKLGFRREVIKRD